MSERRFDSILFNYETTGRTDFRDGRIRPIVKTEYKEKPMCLRIRPLPLKDVHALTDWYNPNVPFNLMHKPKEIVQTNPRVIQKPYSEPEDLLLDEVRRKRPRLVITPAISLDDLDPEKRKQLVEDVYTSNSMRMHKEAGIAAGDGVRAPLPLEPAPADPLRLEKQKPPYVSEEWRMDSVGWDNRQLRTFCDPTKEFWLARDTKCDVCEETAAREARRRMMRESKRN